MQFIEFSFFIDGIMAVEWSASSEWILMTGGCDGAIRFWDIRRAGCFRLLDQRQSQSGRRPPLPKKPTNEVSKMCCIVNAYLVKWLKSHYSGQVWGFVPPQTLIYLV